jgi:hypothetical protein
MRLSLLNGALYGQYNDKVNYVKIRSATRKSTIGLFYKQGGYIKPVVPSTVSYPTMRSW